jgi:hypothetical protein
MKEQIKDWLDVILHPFRVLIGFFILLISSVICALIADACGADWLATGAWAFHIVVVGLMLVFVSYQWLVNYHY